MLNIKNYFDENAISFFYDASKEKYMISLRSFDSFFATQESFLFSLKKSLGMGDNFHRSGELFFFTFDTKDQLQKALLQLYDDLNHRWLFY